MPPLDHYFALLALYAFYQEIVAGFSSACVGGCAVCCTPNVVITSLEARHIAASPLVRNEMPVFDLLRKLAATDLYRPTYSINQLAEACLQNRLLPEDAGVHLTGSCIFLDKRGWCRIYEHRPFACRAMVSRVRCSPGGEADMPSFLVTINLAMHQIIEHLDRGGITGALPDVLVAFGDGVVASLARGVKNRPWPGFLVAPEEQERFAVFLHRLAAWPLGEGCLGDLLPGL